MLDSISRPRASRAIIDRVGTKLGKEGISLRCLLRFSRILVTDMHVRWNRYLVPAKDTIGNNTSQKIAYQIEELVHTMGAMNLDDDMKSPTQPQALSVELETRPSDTRNCILCKALNKLAAHLKEGV